MRSAESSRDVVEVFICFSQKCGITALNPGNAVTHAVLAISDISETSLIFGDYLRGFGEIRVSHARLVSGLSLSFPFRSKRE